MWQFTLTWPGHSPHTKAFGMRICKALSRIKSWHGCWVPSCHPAQYVATLHSPGEVVARGASRGAHTEAFGMQISKARSWIDSWSACWISAVTHFHSHSPGQVVARGASRAAHGQHGLVAKAHHTQRLLHGLDARHLCGAEAGEHGVRWAGHMHAWRVAHLNASSLPASSARRDSELQPRRC